MATSAGQAALAGNRPEDSGVRQLRMVLEVGDDMTFSTAAVGFDIEQRGRAGW